jgi:hypothetical protein
VNEQDKTTTQHNPAETQIPKKEESDQLSPGKRGRKAGSSTNKEKKSNPSFLEIRQQALEALISLSEEGKFHLSFQTAEEGENAINYWT